MKPSHDLFSLIRSLSTSEKNYIRKYATVSSNRKNYYKLLIAISKQEEYDEKALLVKFRKEAFVKHFAVTKKQLFELILKLLRQYTQSNSFSAIINSVIENGKLLYERGLPELGLKQLNKAYDLAKENAAYIKMEEILDYKRLYITQLKAYDWREDVRLLLIEKEFLLKSELEYISYARIYFKLLFLIRRQMFIRTEEEKREIEDILPNGDLPLPKYPEHFNNKLSYLDTNNVYSYLKKDFKTASKYMVKIIEHWEQYPKLIQRHPERYLAAMNNYMNGAYMNKSWKALEYIKPKLNNIPQKTIRIQAAIFENLVLWEITYYSQLKLYDKLFKKVFEIEASLIRLKKSINEVRYFMITRIIAYLYFITGDYNKALEHFDTALNLKQIALRQDEQLFANMLVFFCHYMLGNFIFLKPALRNYRRKINKKGSLQDLESLQFKILLKLCDATNKKESHKLLDLFHKELLALIEKKPEVAFVLETHFNLKIWLEATRKDCTMEVIFKQEIN